MNIKIGDGVILKGDKLRCVITGIQTGGNPGVSIDIYPPQLDGRWHKYPHVFMITAGDHSFDPDPEGPWNSLEEFRCSNKGCYFHKNTGKTAHNFCTNCGEHIVKSRG